VHMALFYDPPTLYVYEECINVYMHG
jgi:hypothetical protein